MSLHSKTIVLRGFLYKISSKIKKAAHEKNHWVLKKTAVELEIFSGVLVVNANQRLHAESICCLDKDEITESYFRSILSLVSEIFLSSNK